MGRYDRSRYRDSLGTPRIKLAFLDDCLVVSNAWEKPVCNIINVAGS